MIDRDRIFLRVTNGQGVIHRKLECHFIAGPRDEVILIRIIRACLVLRRIQIKIYIENRTLKFNSPVDIWFNDSLVISQVKYGNSIAAYNLYSKGNLRITTQIRGFENTRCEYALNVLNDQNYNIVIKFDNANKPGSIFGFKKADGKNFEPYFEENLFHRINIDEDSIFTDKGLNEIIIPHEYSVCHLIFLTFGHELIKIWINDQLILNPYVYSLSTINCKFFTEGKIIIAALPVAELKWWWRYFFSRPVRCLSLQSLS